MTKYYYILNGEKSKMYNSLGECSSKAWSCCDQDTENLTFYSFEQINGGHREECGKNCLIISLNKEEIKMIKIFQWITLNPLTANQFETWIKRCEKAED